MGTMDDDGSSPRSKPRLVSVPRREMSANDTHCSSNTAGN